MTTNNAVNTGLNGVTGTISFVGSDSPTFTTNISTPNLQFTANTITATNTNGGITFTVNGTGLYKFSGTSSNAATIALVENSGNGSNYIALKAPETVSGNVTFTLPSADGTNGQFLSTNGSATLSFASMSGGGITWNNVAGTTQAAAVNNGYVIGNASQTTVTLPATAALGSEVAIAGKGAGGWILTANGGQTIQMGASATSSGGSITSSNQWDTIVVVCVTANTTWVVLYAVSSGLTVT